VCSILRADGQFEAEAIADAAMVPAKDTREVRMCEGHQSDCDARDVCVSYRFGS
jgi:hypothetical protein